MANFLKTSFFFLLGALIATVLLITISYMTFSAVYRNKIYPGVKVKGSDVSGLSTIELEKALVEKYSGSMDTATIRFYTNTATLSAYGKDIGLEPDAKLMAIRAFSIGRQTNNPYYNFSQILAAWNGNIDLPFEISFSTTGLENLIQPLVPLVEKKPIDAIYEFVPNTGPDKKGRVISFKQSEDGKEVDREEIRKKITIFAKEFPKDTSLDEPLPLKTVSPTVKSTTANDLGIKNLLGKGESYFYDSIPGRVYNISLGTEKINGSLVAPNDVFSFDQAIGTVSAVFGFAKAYAIKEGKTVLDDGGGVCQVSTTLYRAALNAGLPILERTAHAYRVGFYEQGGFLPGKQNLMRLTTN
ncbi:VanW family protein [Candidatus Microgenomates bacterium]|nr:VanW family protein [Candidatus Microgenomates bacterium]